MTRQTGNDQPRKSGGQAIRHLVSRSQVLGTEPADLPTRTTALIRSLSPKRWRPREVPEAR